MRTFTLLLLLIAFVFGEESKRLISFGPLPEQKMWMTESEAGVLHVVSNNFMDITDFPEPARKPLPFSPIPTKLTQRKLVDQFAARLEVSNINNTIFELSEFYTRYYTTDTGLEAAQNLYAKYADIAATREDVSVRYFENSFKQPSIIARIEGRNINKAGSVIVLGGHIDSVGSSRTGRAPGADDDASGSATVLEVFRALVQAGYKPNRTVEFHGYAAEEAGLLGSQAIAEQYFNDGIIVESELQLDMTAYDSPGVPLSPLGLVTDFTSPELNNFLKLLIKEYSSLGFVESKCGYGCSDHASWNKYGYRASFPFETPFGAHNPNIHSPRDTLDKLNIEKALEFARFALGYVVEMAQ